MKVLSSESKITKFYSQYPFPNISLNKKGDIYQTLIYNLINGLTKKYLEKYKKVKILDVGCGTGEVDLGLAGKGRDILAIDNNPKSIEIAKMRAEKFKASVKFKVYDFVKNTLPRDYYDFIIASGSLHHTARPEQNFTKLVKSLKKGGYIVIGIYNPYGSFKVRLKRGLLRLLAGDNFEKKTEIYRKLFYRRQLTLQEKVAVADAFANPYRRYYTFEQLLGWFKKNNIEYLDSVPPVEWSKNLKIIVKIVKNIISGKTVNLMDIWQKVTYQSSSKQRERYKLFTTITQLAWVPIGRGELINMVGRKIG